MRKKNCDFCFGGEATQTTQFPANAGPNKRERSVVRQPEPVGPKPRLSLYLAANHRRTCELLPVMSGCPRMLSNRWLLMALRRTGRSLSDCSRGSSSNIIRATIQCLA